MAPVEEDRRKFCPFVARFLLMHCQTGGGVYCSMCAVLHLKKKKIKKKIHQNVSPPCYHSLCYTFLTQHSYPGPQQPRLRHKDGDSSSYLLSVCFCLKSLPPPPRRSQCEGETGKQYADIVKLNLIGTVKTARVW